jgi:hypothetical protein
MVKEQLGKEEYNNFVISLKFMKLFRMKQLFFCLFLTFIYENTGHWVYLRTCIELLK